MSILRSKKKKVFSGIGVDTVGSFIAQGIGIIIIPFYLTYITSNMYGMWLAINALVMMIALFDLPLEQYIVTNGVGELFYKQSFKDELSRVIGIKLLACILVLFLSIGIWWATPFLLNTQDITQVGEVRPLIFVLILSTIINSFISIFYGLLNSQNEFVILNLMTVITLILQSTLPLALMAMGFSLSSFFYSALSVSVLNFIVSFWIVFTKYKHLSFKPMFKKFHLKEELLSYTLSFQAIRWLTLFRTQFILVILNKFLGGNSAAIYNMTNRLPLTLSGYSSKISLPFLPIFSELFHLHSEVDLVITFKRVSKLLTRIGLCLLITGIAFNANFVALWVGKSLVADKWAELIILMTMFFNIIFSCFGIVIFASRKYGKWVIFATIEILLALGLSALLKEQELSGVLLAFFAGFALTNLYLFKHALDLLSISLKDYTKEVFLPAVFANTPLLVSIALVKYFLHADSWAGLTLNGIIILVFGIAMYDLFIFYRKRTNI